MVRSHTRELLAPPKARNACDRCHAQKLRCLKTIESGTCLRCVKFGTQCVFSHRTPRRRIQSQTDHVAVQKTPDTLYSSNLEQSSFPLSTLNSSALTNSWSSSSFAMTMETLDFFNADSRSVANHTNMTIEPHVQTRLWDLQAGFGTDANTPRTITQAVKELADLNVELLDHSKSLPSPLSSSLPQTSPEARLFAIDQTFALTKRLIGISEMLCTGIARPLMEGSCVDRATLLLLLSCYHRLSDIYESIFKHMRGCAENPCIPTSTEAVVLLPVMHIGSYTSPLMPELQPGLDAPRSSFSMHMIFIFILSTRLCIQLQESIITSFCQSSGGDRIVKITEVGSTKDALHDNLNGFSVGSEEPDFFDATRKATRRRSDELNSQMRLTKQALLLFSLSSL